MRPRAKLAIAVGVIVFLAISAGLARWLALENVERNAVLAVLQAEARGHAAAMMAKLHGCTDRCQVTVVADARRLRRPGRVQILAYQSQTSYALTTTLGETRVAWKSSLGRFPVVQCVLVRRSGNAITGLAVSLLAIGPEIPDTADC